jgi:hypothetical protein
MNESLCREFMVHLDLDGKLKTGYADEETQEWLDSLDLSVELKCLMKWQWPRVDCEVAKIRLWPMSKIRGGEITPLLLEHQLFHVGNAINGDWLVVDFSTDACVPGFVTYSEWMAWDDEPENPRKYFQPIARGFDSFLYRLVEKLFVPTDYYAAKEFNEFLAEEGGA